MKGIFKSHLLCFLGGCLFLTPENGENASNAETFAGSTPCSQRTRPLPGIPPGDSCEFMKWELQLLEKNGQRTFILECNYGLPKQGTNGLERGGKKLELKGRWEESGSHTEIKTLRLVTMPSAQTISFSRLGDDLLHLLDNEGHLMIGNPGWSYTLNRIK